MLTSTHRRHQPRRGVVLILILGMLGLMALVGITFAVYSGQAEYNARNFAQGQNLPDHAQVMDFALAQLINDTDNPMSALRTHSLKRDMYGQDAGTNGVLRSRPDNVLAAPGNDTFFYVTLSAVDLTPGPRSGLLKLKTNIPSNSSTFMDYDFRRWFLRLASTTTTLSQTLEIIDDDPSDAGGFRFFWVRINPLDAATTLTKPIDPVTAVGLTSMPAAAGDAPARFELDGRYLRAFNGPGMGDKAKYGNFRVNRGVLASTYDASDVTPGEPTVLPSVVPKRSMDEDYDACDLENWFLAIQSADGQVVVPSFHRPGILTAADWTNVDLATRGESMSKILRPREADGHSAVSFPNLLPDPANNNKITFDVDNDGDGITDAVWLDLGYPATRNTSGQLQKPLFAFTVIGLNGRIPLNTVGNIQQRDADGNPLFSHAAHLGNSPSEIDPRYALQNAFDPNNPLFYTQYDNSGSTLTPNNDRSAGNVDIGEDGSVSVALTQLRNLLTGTRKADSGNNNKDSNLVNVGPPNPIYFPNNLADSADVGTARGTAAVEGRWGEGESISSLVTPAFNNLVRAGLSRSYGDPRDDNFNSYDPDTYDTTAGMVRRGEYEDHYDAAGALLLPVERIRRYVNPIDLAGDGRVTTWNTRNELAGADKWGRVSFFRYFRPPGMAPMWNTQANDSTGNTVDTPPPGGYMPPQRAPGIVLLSPTAALDETNNISHGYESARNPKVTPPPAPPFGPELVAGMPFENATVPTYTTSINTNKVLAGLNEADEMRLYESNANDAPFGASDLEWLNRKHDVDGATLDSRLAQLAPVSFTNPRDGLRRRRMFGVETWETTHYAWAFDAQTGTGGGFPVADPANSTGPQLRAPSLAHGGRKINLNYPLPASNDPKEPIRQKWIRDTYQMFKAVLPLTAVDTPEELAQLSQFAVNIIDFRDPDGTMTRFENRDVVITHPRATEPTKIALASAVPPPVPFTTDYLVQYGMEYNPVAINEILAYQFNRKAGTPPVATPTKRLLIELVNTLTEAAGTAPTPSALDLKGWDLVVMEDDREGRPDPITGQIPVQEPGLPSPTNPVVAVSLEGTPTAPAPRTTRLPALPADPAVDPAGPTATPNYYYVIENKLDNDADEEKTFGPVAPPIDDVALTLKLTVGRYFWLYLRRPPNPFDLNYDSTRPNENRVVVDSFRFFYNASAGNVGPDGNAMPPPAGSEFLYSLQRLQPYRGGHAVPLPTAGPPPPPGPRPIQAPAAYGYSEQAVPARASAASVPMFGKYGDSQVTLAIENTLGKPNNPKDDVWDYVPINDRDFTSVAELLLVPGCSPGLFTKAFAEAAPPIPAPTRRTAPPAMTETPVPPVPPDPLNPPIFGPTPPRFVDPALAVPRQVAQPHSSPYLVENFFYYTTVAPPPAGSEVVGGPSNAGWFKIMEFLEVPSPAAGAVGTVAQGSNFDWYREDVKPGLLNLNLIIDEEVFLGLMADTRLNMDQLPNTGVPGRLVPRVVTGINGTVFDSYEMNNLGFAADPAGGSALSSRLKASFSDFLKLRHGGSGNLFAFGAGEVGTINARERPFHSLSFSDINLTVMRPAALPPPTGSTTNDDAGVKSSVLDASANPQPPPIPPRRLFQIPDAYPGYPTDTPPDKPSNASESGDAAVHRQMTHPNLYNPNASLADASLATGVKVNYLGGAVTVATDPIDHRQNPYFRTEWLQKVTNLTTVRTHQYAVWITVGFFEVTRAGNPQLAKDSSTANLAYDQLGDEIGLVAGKNVRFRSFYILDRTRATGFDLAAPGDFREVVTYSKRIQ